MLGQKLVNLTVESQSRTFKIGWREYNGTEGGSIFFDDLTQTSPTTIYIRVCLVYAHSGILYV